MRLQSQPGLKLLIRIIESRNRRCFWSKRHKQDFAKYEESA